MLKTDLLTTLHGLAFLLLLVRTMEEQAGANFCPSLIETQVESQLLWHPSLPYASDSTPPNWTSQVMLGEGISTCEGMWVQVKSFWYK